MKNEGLDFATVLKEAQARGYAEANPAADVEGVDAARKIVILAALSFGILLDPKTIPTEGITGITGEHTAVAEAFGGAIKLIGHTEKIDGKVYAGVSPYLVPAANPVSHVDDVFNGILVDANMLGRALFYGAGAGKLPTASAVVADIIDVLSNRANERKLPDWRVAQPAEIADADAYACRRCFLIEGCPKCAEKAKAAFGVDQVAMLDSKFAIISKPTTKKAAEAILTAAGLAPVWSLPVLD
jgi:homoserine dehydrogenase